MSREADARIREQMAREEKRRQWMERADKELEAAAAWQADKLPESLGKRLDQMVELCAKADILQPTDKASIRDRAKAAKLVAWERYLDTRLDATMAAARDRTREQEKNELLKEVNQVLATVSRLGGSPSTRESVRAKLEIIRQTSATGDSSKAKEAAEREAQKKEASHQNEHRTFTRWRDPPLTVQIEGRGYTTEDWSLGGLLIMEIPDSGWEPGEEVDIRVGLPEAKLYPEKVEVVRYIAEGKKLAVKVRRFASVLMQVKRDCDAAGMEPSA